ncbi:MAG: replicative DNA helicase [Fimbriimonadales bacterium]
MDALELHLPPHSTDSEMAALGAMLLNRQAADKLISRLNENDFYSPVHREIFRAMVAINHNFRNIDILTLQEELVARASLDKIGGLDYLVQIADSVPSATNADYYADIVVERAMLRDLEGAGHQIVKEVHDPQTTVDDKILDAEKAVFDVSRRRLGKDFAPVSSLAVEFFKEVDRVVDTGEPIHGLPSGLVDLDNLLTGFYPGNLIIVAARPGIGKTSLALWMAYNAARVTAQNVAIFSLEMSSLELVRRYATMLGKVDAYSLKRSRLSDEDYQGLVDGCEKLYNVKLFIDDSTDIGTFDMIGKCRRLKSEEGGLAFVVVDYLQLMRATKGNEGRTQQISEIARGLKNLAKDLDVPVVALSQLSRGIELRDPPVPQLSDLRESGSIEADADVVIMLYRAKADDSGEEVADYSKVAPVDVFIRKNRNGPTDVITLAFEPSYTLFSNAADDLKRGRKNRLTSKSGGGS